ncbi:MAG TPA: hypothetical protein VNP90_10060, partial [Actinomycetota bacterium]|nr:hypothetical protein [Actinomycetota bacterium]
LATLASRPGRRAAATLAVLLLLAACGADAGSAEQPADGLLVLSTDEPSSLDVLATRPESNEAIAIGLPLPVDGATWISAGRGGILVATTTDGGMVTSDPVDPRGSAVDVASVAWRQVDVKDESGASLPSRIWSTTWDPSGLRFAAFSGDRGAYSLLLVEPKEGTLTTIPLDMPLLAEAPVWLDDNRLALVRGRVQAPDSSVLDTTDGKISKGPPGELHLASSADGSVVATSAGPGKPVVLRSSKGWLADDGTSIGSVEVPEGFTEAIRLALDATGRRLAIVWLHEDGTTESHVHDGADGWRRVLATRGGEIAWLR